MSDREELELLKHTFDDFIRTSGDLQRAYSELKEQSQRLSLYLANILENMGDAILVFNNQNQLNLWNRRAEAYFPTLNGARPPIPLESLLHDAPGGLERVLQFTVGDEELEYAGPDRRQWLDVRRSRFMDGQNQRIGFIVQVADTTAFKELQLKSQREDRLRVMGEFAAEVAHEIRNPLASIELMTTLLADDLADQPPAREILGRIRQSVSTMNRTVTNILLFTRNLHPEKQEFAVAELISQSESAILDLVLKKKIEVHHDVPAEQVIGDFELLKQGLINLLLNAAQAVPKNGGRIEVLAKRGSNGDLLVTVKDNGPGIPRSIRAKIFDPFFTTRNTGTGLGLAMARRVVESHDGAISFRSSPRGTSFTMRIPVQ
jgi:signal transduction histidine kinase